MGEKGRKNGSSQAHKKTPKSLNINMNVSLIVPIYKCIFRGMLCIQLFNMYNDLSYMLITKREII